LLHCYKGKHDRAVHSCLVQTLKFHCVETAPLVLARVRF